VEAVIAGERGIIESAGRGHIVMCMSTIDPFVLRRLAELLATRGVATLDAPVSGGTERAKSGELSIIAGGDTATFEKCRDVFSAMGTRLFHVGALGQGLAMKLVNNMLIQVNRVAVAEALVMGVKAGLDPRTIYDVIRVSTGTSFAFETGVPKILARDFSPGGTVDITYKDQELETAFAKQLGVPLLLANLTQQLYQMARAAGLNKEDGLAVVKVLERLAGVQVKGAASPRAPPRGLAHPPAREATRLANGVGVRLDRPQHRGLVVTLQPVLDQGPQHHLKAHGQLEEDGGFAGEDAGAGQRRFRQYQEHPAAVVHCAPPSD
jgi:3-hydroxyisobutyrate dehydrogenase-like beta-hydroxyacid dehydrogenase